MSYEIQIWSVDPIPLPDALPNMEKWDRGGNVWIRSAGEWQIVVSASVEVLFEDVPEDVRGTLLGISFLAELHLEPIGAPKSAHKLLSKVATCLAKAAHGVVLDLQTSTITTPSGVRRYLPERRDGRFSILALSWWFTKGPLLSEAGLYEFVDLLGRMLPEAMPRRYGRVQPPQYLYSETGREHFLGFLKGHLDQIVVWYPHRPVVGVSVFCSPEWGSARHGFRANYVRLEIEAEALGHPGWHTGLDGFWRAASQVIQPFYGDIRTLKGFVWAGPTCASDIETDFHPVNWAWWTGIPRTVGHAVVLGEPYLTLWPRFVEAAQVVDRLAFLSTGDWTTQKEASGLVGGVPDAIAQRWVPNWITAHYGGQTINWNTEYPPIWPFESAGAG